MGSKATNVEKQDTSMTAKQQRPNNVHFRYFMGPHGSGTSLLEVSIGFAKKSDKLFAHHDSTLGFMVEAFVA